MKARRLVDLSKFYAHEEVNTDLSAEVALLEDSLYEFTKAAWGEVEPNEWVDAWHLAILCEHLEAVYKNEINYLLINMPFRTGKSLIQNVFFPAWCWAKDPALRIFYVCYSQEVAKLHSAQNRDLIGSSWYKKRWGHKFNITTDNILSFGNNKYGRRFISSVGGKATGLGADIIFADDPNNVREGESKTIRDATNLWWSRSMSSRWNKASTFRKVVSQQRVSYNDLSGYILAQENPNVIHLCLPMEFEKGRRCVTVPLRSTNGKKWKDPRSREGELLWPQNMPKAFVDQLKLDLGSEFAVSAQLQQRPSSAKGGIFKKDYFSWWKEEAPPDCHFIIQSWDTALSASADACYSACLTFGVFKDRNEIDNIILLDLWSGRVEYPQLREMAQRLSRNIHDTILEDPEPAYSNSIKPDMILVEAKANGLSLLQDLRQAGVPASRFDPKRCHDKMERARLASPWIEAGRVWVPARPPNYESLRRYADRFVEACVSFPHAESNDIVDAMSQAFMKIKEFGEVYHPNDLREIPEVNVNIGKKLY